MSAQNNGGPAFPLATAGGSVVVGISARDYFAAKAMQALIGTPDYLEGNWSNENVAQDAYALAGAMLAERAK